MATTLLVQGGEIELSDSFNKTRDRLNKALKQKIDYENSESGGEYKPAHTLSFKTADNGRVAINPDKVIGVLSDEPKDMGSASEDDDEE
jgi:hypothetical protein